jgi:hypothetical protein
MEKPFYISQLPEKTQTWIKEKTKENFLKDGMSEEEAEQKATDFLDEKVNVAEDFFGKDFYKSLDAIKDNFTPPGAEEVVKEEIDTNDNGKIEVDEMADFQKSLDDYSAKNKKGRDDIPVTTRR